MPYLLASEQNEQDTISWLIYIRAGAIHSSEKLV